MLRAMMTAASGMAAQELNMDVTANNLANVNTTGFKRSRAEFQDLLYETIREPGAATENNPGSPTGLQVGQGVKSVATQREMTEGSLRQTGNPLDVAIEGQGYFQFRDVQHGTLSYSRDGGLRPNSEGLLVNASGMPLEPAIRIPDDAVGVTIDGTGQVSVVRADDPQPTIIGTIELASFTNDAGLKALGGNLLSETASSGTPSVAAPGTAGIGNLSQGFLEGSNVKVIEEMIQLISTQRAYETNSKVIQAADEMLRSTAALR